MDKVKYYIAIRDESKKVVGRVSNKAGDYAEFSPLTILGDIVYSVYDIESEGNIARVDKEFSILFGFQKIDNTTPTESWHYFYAARYLKKIVRVGKIITMNDMERLKPFLKLEFILTNIIETSISDTRTYLYYCYSKADVLYAILHYLIMNDYKFSECHHCINYFATKTYKQKYCKRKSPCFGYEKYECEQAVREFKRKLARRRKAICNNLSMNYTQEHYLNFLDVCDTYKKEVDERSTTYNLESYESFLSKDNIKRNFYIESNKVKSK